MLASKLKQERAWERNRIAVLFLCTANSCRSQMAEGFLRYLGGDRFEVKSAGARATALNPMAVKAMAEIGIDISGQQSKPVDAMISSPFDYVITVCNNSKQACPLTPAAGSVLHWDVEDPVEARGTEAERREAFLRVRKEIQTRVAELIPSCSL